MSDKLSAEELAAMKHGQNGENPFCADCGELWPCDAAELLGHIAALEAELAELKKPVVIRRGEPAPYYLEPSEEDAEIARLRAVAEAARDCQRWLPTNIITKSGEPSSVQRLEEALAALDPPKATPVSPVIRKAVMRVRYQKQGGHYHCRVFTARGPNMTYARCGELVFDENEWDEVQCIMKGAEFLEEDPPKATP